MALSNRSIVLSLSGAIAVGILSCVAVWRWDWILEWRHRNIGKVAAQGLFLFAVLVFLVDSLREMVPSWRYHGGRTLVEESGAPSIFSETNGFIQGKDVILFDTPNFTPFGAAVQTPRTNLENNYAVRWHKMTWQIPMLTWQRLMLMWQRRWLTGGRGLLPPGYPLRVQRGTMLQVSISKGEGTEVMERWREIVLYQMISKHEMHSSSVYNTHPQDIVPIITRS